MRDFSALADTVAHSEISCSVVDEAAFADLQLVHSVPPERRIEFLADRLAATLLAEELTRRCLACGGADEVGHHRTDVPQGAFGRRCPLRWAQRFDQLAELPVLDGSELHCLVVIDAGDRGDVDGCRWGLIHFFTLLVVVGFFVGRVERRSTSATSTSTTRRARSTHRSPPGSFATC